jgi:hypothetical protein
MNTALIPLLALTSASMTVESRTLLTGPADDAKTAVILNQKILANGRVTRISRTVNPDKSLSYSEEVFTLDGIPISTAQEGFWSDQWHRFSTAYSAKGAVQTIDGAVNKTDKPAKFFADPTVAWFWRVKPKTGTTVTVNVLAQNVISVFQLQLTYEADESLTLAGKTLSAHRVKEVPLSAPKGVYSVYWYDDAGMIVKRYHKTTTSEFGYQLTAWR